MEQKRNHFIDILRGLALLSMIAYHTMWDLVFLFSWDAPRAWYTGTPGFLWQQSICFTFLLLSGYCTNFGTARRTLRRGLLVSLCGLLIMVVTALTMPASRVRFGILTLIGTGMLLAALAGKKSLHRAPARPYAKMLLFILLFLVTYRINRGYLLFPGIYVPLPDTLYRNNFTAFLGFPPADFFSTDYFSLLPWLFLFFTGKSLFPLFAARETKTTCSNRTPRLLPKILSFPGRHTLPIYMMHQPVIYGILWMVNALQTAP